MEDKLDQIYQQMLKESNDKMTVGTVKPGEIEGAEKAEPIKQVTTKDNTVDAPKEGPSSGEVAKGGAVANSSTAKDTLKGKKGDMPKGKKNAMENKEEVLGDSVAVKATKFEDLYKSVLGEDLDLGGGNSEEVVPAPEIEGDEFDEEQGDFGAGEADVEEETSVAAELRAMAERMNELADKYAELTGEGKKDEEGMEDLEDLEGDEGVEAEEEGLKLGESFKNQPEPKPAKKTTLGPKMSKTVKGKLSSVSAKHAQGSIKGKHDGVPQKLGDAGKKFNTTGMTAKGKGPAVAKKATDFLAK